MKMRFCGYAGVVAMGLVCLVGIGYFLLEDGQNNGVSNVQTIKVKYSFDLHNNTSKSVKNAKLLVSTPIAFPTRQYCRKVEANFPFKTTADNTGNTYIEMNWDIIPPYAAKVVVITSEVEVLQSKLSSAPVILPLDLADEPYIEATHELIKSKALELKVKDKKETVRRIFAWVSENIQYSGYVKKNRGALYALKQKKGDCTEFATLFVALCRANEIPARFVGGFVTSKSAALGLGDYHNWAEYHLDGSWHTADPQNKVLMNEEKEPFYIVYKIIRPSNGDNGALLKKISGHELKIEAS